MSTNTLSHPIHNSHFDEEWAQLIDSLRPVFHGKMLEDPNARAIVEMGELLEEELDQLAIEFEGRLIGVCRGLDEIFSARSQQQILEQMEEAGGQNPYLITYVPSRFKRFSDANLGIA